MNKEYEPYALSVYLPPPYIAINIFLSSKDATFTEISQEIKKATNGAYSLRKDRMEDTMTHIKRIKCVPEVELISKPWFFESLLKGCLNSIKHLKTD